MAAYRGEVVHVWGRRYLVNSEWQLCTYATRDGRTLPPGFYFVLHSGPCGVAAGNRIERCYGPFASGTIAEKIATSARYLGVVTGADEALPHAAAAAWEDKLPALDESMLPLAIHWATAADTVVMPGMHARR